MSDSALLSGASEASTRGHHQLVYPDHRVCVFSDGLYRMLQGWEREQGAREREIS